MGLVWWPQQVLGKRDVEKKVYQAVVGDPEQQTQRLGYRSALCGTQQVLSKTMLDGKTRPYSV